MPTIRDDSAGSYGTWDNNDLSWLDFLTAKASDGGNALANLGRNLAQGFSPIGTSEQGNMALQVPPIVSGIAQSYSNLAGSPSHPGNAYDLTGVPELDAPIQQDMSNVLLSLYGGNAVSGITKPKGALGAGAMKDAAALPMDHASRMARAREMGFDTDRVLYHGTRKDFDAFMKPQKYSQNGPGVYMAADPSVASEYAMLGGHLEDARVLPLYAKSGKFATGAQVYELAGELARAGKATRRADALELAVQQLKDEGYVGTESGGYTSIFEPSNIRSVNAAFDPARAGENGLLLSDTGKPSILGSAMAGAGEGKPIRAYHGTRSPAEITKFNADESFNIGPHFGSLPTADLFAGSHPWQWEGPGNEHLIGKASQFREAAQAAKSKDEITRFSALADSAEMAASPENGRILPVVLDMQNPLAVDNLVDRLGGAWRPSTIANVLSDNGVPFSPDDMAVLRAADGHYPTPAVNEQNGTVFSPGKYGRNTPENAAANALLRQRVTDAGYDGLRYRDVDSGSGYAYIGIKPNTVRSATTGETLFSDNRPSLIGSALATAGQNYELPPWLQF